MLKVAGIGVVGPLGSISASEAKENRVLDRVWLVVPAVFDLCRSLAVVVRIRRIAWIKVEWIDEVRHCDEPLGVAGGPAKSGIGEKNTRLEITELLGVVTVCDGLAAIPATG